MVRTKHVAAKLQSTAAVNSDDDNDEFSWRQSDEPPAKPLQHGVSPSTFYREANKENANSTPNRRRQRDELKKLLNKAKDTTVREQRREVTTKQKLKRAAFKEETCLKTWPLQDMAMRNLDDLMGEHIHGKKLVLNDKAEKEHGDSTGLSSSSMEEPKRIKPQDETLSPRKSTMRHQFKQEFSRERQIPAADKDCKENNELGGMNDKDFLPALWCMEPRIFAVEKSAAGKRKYLVGHLGRFLDLYWRKCDPKNRHYYELIREKTPCRLYFDLEFSKPANAEISNEASETLLNEFYQELAAELQTVHNVSIDRSCVVDLDSSTDKKFSRHWIVHLPNQALFPDAGAVGRFVKKFVGRLAEEAATSVLDEKSPTLSKHLFVNTKKSGETPSQTTPDSSPILENACPTPRDGIATPFSELCSSTPQASCTPCSQGTDSAQTTCFVDIGVYTRNRLFRLLGSSKFGKPASAALRIATSNEFPFPKGFANDSFYVPDMENKSQDQDKDKEELDTDMSQFLTAVDWTVHAEALAETLVVPINGSKLNFPILPDVDPDGSDTPDSVNGKLVGYSPSEAPKRKIILSSASGAEVSPFPSLDDFVVDKLGSRGGAQGAIRAWSIDYRNPADGALETPNVPQYITYQMSRNRWCERIGRAHKSNNIMWTVDLQNMTCVQACHDPECRTMRFRGTPVTLPDPVRQDVEEILFEQQLALMDEQELAQKQSAASQKDEVDDEEFERALLNLDISGKSEKGDDQDSKQVETPQPAGAEKPPSNKTAVSTAEPAEQLTDSALFDAVLNNPELFP